MIEIRILVWIFVLEFKNWMIQPQFAVYVILLKIAWILQYEPAHIILKHADRL